MREYLNFIKRNFRHFVIQSSSQLIEFVLTVSFSLILVSSSSVQELGYFALVFRILNAPGMIISDYVSQLSLNRVSDFESNHHKLIFLIKIFFLLVGLSILLSLVLQFLGGDIFTLLFGEKWARSGEIVSYYVWGITATFTIRSLQYLPNSIDRQEIYTVVSFLSYGLPVLFIYYYVDWGWSLFEALTVLSVCLQLLSFSYFMILVYLFNKPE